MPIGRSDVNMTLWEVGEQVEVSFERVDDANGIVTWNLPDKLNVYDGLVVLMHTQEIQPVNFPVDGQRYQSSGDYSDWNADDIGGASVVGAFYGDKMTTSLNVTGLVTDEVYFVSVHVVDNTLRYFTDGKFSYNQMPETDAFTGHIKKLAAAPSDPVEGTVYFNTAVSVTMMWDGTEWIPCTRGPVRKNHSLTDGYGAVNDEFRISYVTGAEFPETDDGDIPAGRFFFHQPLAKLFVWTGTKWVQANSADEGTPMYMTQGIGTDGSSDEFAAIINNIKRQMGYPVVCIELKEENFNMALDSAVAQARRRLDNAYRSKFVMYQLKKGQQRYYLNDPANGTDKIVDIMKISRASAMGGGLFEQFGVYAQGFMQQFIAGGVVDLTSIHALAEYSEIFERIFANDIQYTFDEASRELLVLQSFPYDLVVILEVASERTDQELLRDRHISDWIEDWAKAEAMQTLGWIRTKYASLPGAGGGTQLNGQELLASSDALFEELKRQVNDLEVGNGTEFGNTSFCIG